MIQILFRICVSVFLVICLSLYSCTANKTVDKPEAEAPSVETSSKEVLPKKIVSQSEIYFEKGKEAEKSKDLDKAVEYYRLSIDSNPENPMALFNLGAVLFDKGDYEGSIDYYNQYIAMIPDYADAFNNRGFAYEMKGDIKAAIQDYNTAISIDPEMAFAYNNRGKAYKLKEYKMAHYDVDKALEINPFYGSALINKGLIYFDQKQMTSALNYLTRAIEVRPDLVTAYSNRAIVFDALKEYSKALPDFLFAAENGDVNATYNLAVYYKNGYGTTADIRKSA